MLYVWRKKLQHTEGPNEMPLCKQNIMGEVVTIVDSIEKL